MIAWWRSLSLKEKRRIWTFVFLGWFTLGAIVLECIAGLWHPAGWTIPWTEYIARYVPWPIQILAFAVGVPWLVIHFWRHDHLRSVAYREGYAKGRLAGRADYEQVYGVHTEDTLFKVVRGLEKAGVAGQAATDAVGSMQNEGVLFRERVPRGS